MKRERRPARRAAACAVLITMLAAGCAPSTGSDSGPVARPSDSASTSGPSTRLEHPDTAPKFVVPEGADNQMITLEQVAWESLPDLLSVSKLVVIGKATEVLDVKQVAMGPTEFPSDAPDFKKVPSPGVTITYVRFDVEQVLKGDADPAYDLRVGETGRTEAPLIKPNTTYLLFLGERGDLPGTFYEPGGASQSRYVIDDAGIIRPSVPRIQQPYREYVFSWVLELLGQRIEDVIPKLR
jgi:hypothetical protein